MKRKIISILLIILMLMAFIPTGVFASESTVVKFSLKNDGNKYISTDFKVKEFKCKCRKCDDIYIDLELVAILQKIRDHFGDSVTISSGYRCINKNGSLPRAVSDSYHLYGRAADITVTGATPLEVAKYAESIGVKGIGRYGSNDGYYVHLDTRPSKSKYFYYYYDKKYHNVKSFVGSYNSSLKFNFKVSDLNGYSEDLSFDNCLNINMISYPVKLTKGESFPLMGLVSSDYTISSVVGQIIDSAGKVVQSIPVNPNARSFMITGSSNFDTKLKFGKLTDDVYTLRITATDSVKTVKWEKTFTVGTGTSVKYTVKFDTDSGNSVSDITVAANSKYGTLPTPKKDGYEFVGWYTAKTGGNKVTADTVVTSNHTLYARWQKEAESTLSINMTAYPTTHTKGKIYNLKGTVGSNYNITSAKGEIIDSAGKVVQSVTVSPNAKTHSIEGSNINNNLKFGKLTDDVYTLRITATDSKQTVKWEKTFTVGAGRKYTVKFDTDGAGSVSDITVTAGGKYGALPKPTREGYNFLGWYTAKTGGNKVTADTVVSSNHTLYARWETDEIMLVTEVIINTLPDKTVYSVGEEFDMTGMSVKVIYADGSSIILDVGYDVTGYDPSVAGIQTLKASFMGISDEFEVEVFGNVLFILGDVNNDGKINALDATQILRYANNKSSVLSVGDEYDIEIAKYAADVNGDNKINALDATQILRYANNKSSALKK